MHVAIISKTNKSIQLDHNIDTLIQLVNKNYFSIKLMEIGDHGMTLQHVPWPVAVESRHKPEHVTIPLLLMVETLVQDQQLKQLVVIQMYAQVI